MTGARTTIYLSRETLEALRVLGLSVSEICQRALQDAIEARIAQLQHDIDGADLARTTLEELKLISHHDEP